MNINLDMVLVIQSILCVHAELKLKLKNVSFSAVNFKVLKDFWKYWEPEVHRIKFLFYCMVLEPIPKLSIKEFLKI